MNAPLLHSRRLNRALLGAVLANALATVVFAQQGARLGVYREGMATAKNLAAANDAVGAENALIKLNQAKPNTAAWNMETAQRLLQTAEWLTRNGRSGAMLLVTRAQQQLTQAETAAKTDKDRASAKMLSGLILERYLANPAAALVAYQVVLGLNPNSQQAKEAVARLQLSEAKWRKGGGR